MLNQLQVFQGETTTASARLYLWLPLSGLDGAADVNLQGNIRGPFSDYATTLPSTIRLQASNDDDALLGEAVVPDPCTWTIDLPSTYVVQVELTRGEEVIASTERMFGFRKFGIVGRNFAHEGKRWVLRGAAFPSESLSTPKEFLPAFRDSRLVACVPDPPVEFCELASKVGVMVFAELSKRSEAELCDSIRKMAPIPSVIAVTVDQCPAHLDRSYHGGLLVGAGQGAADFLVVAKDQLPASSELPIVVRANQPALQSAADLRRRCEILQEELTPEEFAGYCV